MSKFNEESELFCPQTCNSQEWKNLESPRSLKDLEHSHFLIIHKNNTITCHRYTRLGFPRADLLKNIHRHRKTIKTLIINEVVSPGDYNIPKYVENIYFNQPRQDLGRANVPLFGEFKQVITPVNILYKHIYICLYS